MSLHAITRRQFVKTAGAGAAALGLARTDALAGFFSEPKPAPKHFAPADRKLRIACVGCGGKGASDIGGVAGEDLVALCDVDANRAKDTFRKFPNVPKYRDYRQMLMDVQDKIDAVTVSTPDHMHFPVAMMAMQMGKHVFVQKPCAHTIWEARQLTEAARARGLVTQMGNQGMANEGTRLIKEWVQSGSIGDVREVHSWTNRPIWPQGIDRPATEEAVPETLDWNLWLGVAPERPYNKCYLPFDWRGWWDFGCGALGDMGCHILNAPFWALDLKYPTSVEAECDTRFAETGPKWSIVTYKFPARGKLPPVTVKWFDGNKQPPRPKELEAGRQFSIHGTLIFGSKGVIMDGDAYADSPRLIPESAMQSFQRPPKTIPRIPGSDPHKEWIRACKGGPACGSNFDHAGPLTEMVLMGNLAIRLGRKIEWDGPRMRCLNIPEAERLIRLPYRIY